MKRARRTFYVPGGKVTMFHRSDLAFDELLETRQCMRCLPSGELDRMLDPLFHAKFSQIKNRFEVVIFHHHREGKVCVAYKKYGTARGGWVEADGLDEALQVLEGVTNGTPEVRPPGP